MKKYVGFMILGVLLFGSSLASAEERDRSPRGSNEGKWELNNAFKDRREDFRDKMEEKREAFRSEVRTFGEGLRADRQAFLADLKLKREEFRKQKSEEKVKFCGKAQEMVTKRFGGAITQLEMFQVKLGDIIVELEAEGKDTTLATESLDLSKAKLSEAKAKLLAVKALLPVNCTNMTPETFEKIKLGAREAKDLLKESRQNLHQVIKEIKALRGEDKEEDEKDED